ncbi:hypothetical protein BSKO_02287 [Bryopsis sp. KO-2023]|nr:hypothetical protein BSKO_02287 [Bryopsis sp. KO-2023]
MRPFGSPRNGQEKSYIFVSTYNRIVVGYAGYILLTWTWWFTSADGGFAFEAHVDRQAVSAQMRTIFFLAVVALAAAPAALAAPGCKDNSYAWHNVMGKRAYPLGPRAPKDVMWRLLSGASTPGHKGPALGDQYVCMNNVRYDGFMTPSKSNRALLTTGSSCGYDQQLRLEVYKNYGHTKTWRLRSRKGYQCARCWPSNLAWEWDKDECNYLTELQFWIAEDDTVAIQHCSTGQFIEKHPNENELKCWGEWNSSWDYTRVWWSGWKVGTKNDWKPKRLWKKIAYGQSCSGLRPTLGVKATYGSSTSTTVGSSDTLESTYRVQATIKAVVEVEWTQSYAHTWSREEMQEKRQDLEISWSVQLDPYKEVYVCQLGFREGTYQVDSMGFKNVAVECGTPVHGNPCDYDGVTYTKSSAAKAIV